ncbi:MAG: signal peptide peptidase SppA [Myxococcota bacterium]|nr:signal peptide peptidase SppA [Myxococcota bacterium]
MSVVQSLTRPIAGGLSWLGAGLLQGWLGVDRVLELELGAESQEPLLLLSTVEAACRLPEIRGLLIHLGGLGWGWASLKEWRDGLERVRASGVQVVVLAEGLSNGSLYLASVADRVLVPPMGEVSLTGVGGSLRFFGPALESLGLRFDVVSAGAYKSMGEAFTRRVASPENREATQALVDGLNEELLACIGESRKLSREDLDAVMVKGPMSPQEATDLGLIDGLAYDGELDGHLAGLLGIQEGDVERVKLGQISRALGWVRRLSRYSQRLPSVAVLHLAGNITMGHEPQGRQRIAPGEVIPVLRELKEDEEVRSVVLAVNSPGGSVLASDLIWKEVAELNEVKPVVACFGDVSASGGYYISAPARKIYASPGTVTGSIGVVGGKLVTGEAASRLGVFSEAVGGGPHLGMYRPDEPFTPEQRQRFKERLAHAYKGFLERVSQGRGRPVEEIEPVAQGRVWAGRDALERGLVDGLGGLTQAVNMARELAQMAGPYKRVDLAVRPPANLLRRLLPAGLVQMLGPVGRLAPMLRLPPAAELLLEAPGQALAVMPVEVELS